jgi:hypothetical protein
MGDQLGYVSESVLRAAGGPHKSGKGVWILRCRLGRWSVFDAYCGGGPQCAGIPGAQMTYCGGKMFSEEWGQPSRVVSRWGQVSEGGGHQELGHGRECPDASGGWGGGV